MAKNEWNIFQVLCGHVDEDGKMNWQDELAMVEY